MTAELILQGVDTVSPQQTKICPLLLGLINWSFVVRGRWHCYLFIPCVLKKQYESYYWQEERQLLLDIVLVYKVLKGAALYYVCVELRKRPNDSCCVCSDCPPWGFEVTNWTLANSAKPCIHWFLPHTTSVPALMTFLPGDIPHTESA